MVLATYDSGLYKICLILHIFCAIVGFGAVFLNEASLCQGSVRVRV